MIHKYVLYTRKWHFNHFFLENLSYDVQKKGSLSQETAFCRILGYFLMRNIKEESSLLTHQCCFCGMDIFVGALCHTYLLPAVRGLSASVHWLRWLRNPLEAALETAVATQRGICHPLLPLPLPSPLASQSLLFLLLSVIPIL